MKMEANGNIMITNHGITVPLRDCSGEVELSIALVPSQLHRYGVWAGAVDGTTGEPDLQFLFLWVSDAEAELLQMELAAVHPVEDLGKASPFLLLTLSQPLDSIHKAILSSMMDMMGLESENADLMRPFSQDQGLAALSSGTGTHILSVLGFDLGPTEGLQNQADFATGHNESQSCPVSQVPEEQNIEQPERSYTLLHHRVGDSYEVSMTSRPASSWRCYQHQNQTRSLIKFPPPPFKRGITVTIEDLQCLDDGEFLNDVIIDFYLNYLILEKAPRDVAKKSHVFSSFFYKQLTRKDNASEDSGSTSTQHRRHQKVRTWTRNIDIFNKDYLFIPVNQESHWYLVIICFPGLEEPQLQEWSGPASIEVNKLGSKSESRAVTGAFRSQSLNGITQTGSTESGQSQETVRGHVAMPRRMAARGLLEQDCTQLGCRNRTVCKRPCILIMDSLKQSVHERVFKLLREYLEVEWEVRRGVPRNFTPENMTSSHCMVPKQDNSSDCGLYLLQYAESFLQNPVVHFDLPLHLETWFSRQTVRRKREEIRNLVLHLYRRQQGVQ